MYNCEGTWWKKCHMLIFEYVLVFKNDSVHISNKRIFLLCSILTLRNTQFRVFFISFENFVFRAHYSICNSFTVKNILFKYASIIMLASIKLLCRKKSQKMKQKCFVLLSRYMSIFYSILRMLFLEYIFQAVIHSPKNETKNSI